MPEESKAPHDTPESGGEEASAEGASDDMPRSLDQATRLRAKMEQLKEPIRDWTDDELTVHLRDWKRMKASTIDQRLRDLRRMGSHRVVPVRLHGTRYELVDSFYTYVKYREEDEGKAATAVVNDFKAVRALGGLLGIPNEFWPKPPTVPRKAKRPLPSPESVHELLHADYTANPKESYNNALVKYLLALDFGFGLRFPNEAFALRIGDFDPKTHTLVVTEPKKGGSSRRLLIEPEWLCCSRRHASLANYLTWRRKVDRGLSDAFFLKQDGTPFKSKVALKRFLDKHVKPRYPWFHCYLGRKWSANARLIEWNFDYARVADWLGHENVDMTRHNYEADARLHEKLFRGGWLLRAFQKPPTVRRLVRGESVGAASGIVSAPVGI